MNDVEKVRDLLNFTGYPFQHHVADRISKLEGFQLSTEYPFTFPQSNAARLGTHGSMDILAACPSGDRERLVWFVVECKKANDKIKNWILLPDKHQDPQWPTFTMTNEGLRGEGEHRLSITRSVRFPGLGYSVGEDFDYCVNGIEANTHLKATNSNSSEKIYNPLKQVVHGTRAFEVCYPKLVESIKYTREQSYEDHIFLPVIVTTANIYTADIPVDEVAQGEIPPGALRLSEPKKWVTYEFPLPDYLGYEVSRGKGKTSIAKRTVFIVNDKAMEEFFTGAVEIIKIAGLPRDN